ncbi:MAG: hypothetical protein U9R24_08080 [Thermodesulfobacteriota bacterium]|nr:hypothetical protein [Thermodesulfobacteriota bacterium]
MSDIVVRAGRAVFDMIKDGGFDLNRITHYIGPGAGPRWLIASGFDLTLLKNEVLGSTFPVTLVGSSAGALRFAAWIQPEYEKSYRNLMESYISMTFRRRDNSGSILRAISNVINDFIEDDALPFALTSKRYRLAIITVRARNLTVSERSLFQGLGLGAAFLLNAIHRSWIRLFFQRVVFYGGAIPPQFYLKKGFKGKAVPLDVVNFKHVIMASSSIPLVVAGVRDIYGAQNGIYRDGGLTDYHLNQRYAFKEEEAVLLFTHQRRIVPGWMDKKLRYRKPLSENLENVLMVYPSEDFAQKLPGGKVPDRQDFKTFVSDPKTRIENWRKAVKVSETLGEEFLEMVASGKIRNLVKKM